MLWQSRLERWQWHLIRGKSNYPLSDEIWPNSYCCILVLRNDYIKNNHDVVQSFVSRYVELGEQADKKEADFIRSIRSIYESGKRSDGFVAGVDFF